MKKLTLSLDEETARLARIRAAERDMSVSRYIGELLRKELRHDDAYEAAYRAWRARKPFPLKGPPEPYPKREELYDRGPCFVDANASRLGNTRRYRHSWAAIVRAAGRSAPQPALHDMLPPQQAASPGTVFVLKLPPLPRPLPPGERESSEFVAAFPSCFMCPRRPPGCIGVNRKGKNKGDRV